MATEIFSKKIKPEDLEVDYILPFRVSVCADFWYDDAIRHFDSHDKRMIDLRRPKRMISTKPIDYDTYVKLISINSASDVYDFYKDVKHKQLPFVLHGAPYARIKEFEYLDRYYEQVGTLLTTYNRVYEFIFSLRAFYKEHTAEQLNRAVDAYNALYPQLRRQNPRVCSCIEGDPTIKVLRGAEIAVCKFINNICENARIELDIHDKQLGLRFVCPDLYTALYIMLYVTAQRENTFAVCAKQGCNRYFVVDKSHPQKLCPIHMKPRRKKRTNAKEKEREKIKNEFDMLWDD